MRAYSVSFRLWLTSCQISTSPAQRSTSGSSCLKKQKKNWLPQHNYVLEQRPTDSSPRADRLSPTASASELTNIITLLTFVCRGGRR